MLLLHGLTVASISFLLRPAVLEPHLNDLHIESCFGHEFFPH